MNTLANTVDLEVNWSLFAITSGVDTYGNINSGRIGSFSITRNGAKIIDLISVRVGTVGYMYDRVTRKLFGNKGTGAFVLGPDVATPVMGLRRYPQIGGAA